MKIGSEQSDLSLSCHSSSFDELDPDNNDSRVNHYQFEPYASDAQLSDENVPYLEWHQKLMKL
jgi:hypothetical protein